MKTVSSAMQVLLSGYQFFVADLYKITLANGDIYIDLHRVMAI